MSKIAKVPPSVPVYDQSALSHWGFFHVGGDYETETENIIHLGSEEPKVMRGQMYVEVFVPKRVTEPYPLVLMHGSNMTGLSWLGTPDGRKSWGQYFLEKGYIVYIVDAPSRGRAHFLPRREHAPREFTTEFVRIKFSSSDKPMHTQWPSGGNPGDPGFDAFCATLTPSLTDREMQAYMQKAMSALLDLIGEAIIVGHSQSGCFSWLIADVRPSLVKGIVQLEPAGPPFAANGIPGDKPDSWGLALIPLTYEPPVTDPSEFEIVRVEPENEQMVCGYLQKEPARQLVNLKNIPILIITGSASYHAAYDHYTARFLEQAGVKNTFVNLADIGMEGNGHMMMLEKNNLEIADFVNGWLHDHLE